MRKFIFFLLTFFTTLVIANGYLQDADFKTEADLGNASLLLNDTKIYVTGNGINKTLDDAIVDGDIGGGVELTVKGNLIGFGTATEECVLDKTDGKLLTVDSTATCGFDFKDAPVSTTLDTKGQLQSFDGTDNIATDVCNDGEYLVWDSTTSKGTKCSSFLTGTLNPVTDWEDCDASSNFVATDTYAKCAYVGDTLHVRILSEVSGSNSAGDFTWDLPTGVTIDTTKLGSSSVNDKLDGTYAGTFDSFGRIMGYPAYLDSNTIKVLVLDDASGSSHVYSSLSDTFPRSDILGDKHYLTVSIPVVGKSSGVDAVVQNKTLAVVMANGSTTNLSGDTTIVFTTEVEDNTSSFNGTTFTVPEDSGYLFHFTAETATSTGTGNFIGSLFVNGSPASSCAHSGRFWDYRDKMYDTTNSRKTASGGSIYCKLEKDDLVTFVINDANNGSLNNASVSIVQQPKNFALAGTFGYYEEKYLSADITSDTVDIADLRYTDLEIGKNYRVCLKPRGRNNSSGNDNFDLAVYHDGSFVTSVVLSDQNTNLVLSSQTCRVFEATTTTLTFNAVSLNSGTVIEGNGGIGETWVSLELVSKEIR